MNRREQTILAATIVIAVLAVAYRFMPEDFSIGGSAVSIPDSKARFEETYRYLQSASEISSEYGAVNTQIPERSEDSSPETTFSNQVAEMLEERGFEKPAIKPGKSVEIKSVADYIFIELEVSLAGSREQVMGVLSSFDQKRLLIKSFQIEKRNMDVDMVDLKVVVSRLARAEEEPQPRRPGRRGRI